MLDFHGSINIICNQYLISNFTLDGIHILIIWKMFFVSDFWLFIFYHGLIAGQLVEHNVCRERKFDSSGHIQSAQYLQHSVAEMGCILPSLQPISHFFSWKQKHLQTAKLDAFLMATNGQVKYMSHMRDGKSSSSFYRHFKHDRLESCVNSWDQTPIDFAKMRV